MDKQKQLCAIKGMVVSGRAMGVCPHIIVGMEKCGHDGKCQHQVIQTPKPEGEK